MKEKYILTETYSQKYSLNELATFSKRFILQEASVNADINKVISALNTKLTNYQNLQALVTKLAASGDENTEVVSKLTDLQNIANDIDKQTAAKAGDDVIIDQISKYFDTLITILEDTVKLDYTKVPNLKSIINKYNSQKASPKVSTLKDLFTKIVPLISTIFKDVQTPTENKELIKKLEKLIEEKNMAEKSISDIEKLNNSEKLGSDTQFYETILTKLNNTLPETIYNAKMFTQGEGTGLEVQDFNIDDFELENIEQNTDKAIEAFEIFNDSYKQTDAEIKQNITKSAKKDWYHYIGEATDKNAAWDEYFKTEWKENADKVKSLGLAVYRELQDLGFTEASNPFIAFLKNNFIGGKHLPLNADNYAILHNAFANRIISSKDLLGQGELGSSNIIFNKTLYEAKNSDMRDLINYQQKIIDNYARRDRILTNKTKAELVTAILTENGNPMLDQMGNINGKVKTAKAANEVLLQCFPEEINDEEKEVVTNQDIKRWCDQYKGQEWQAIGYLWSIFHIVDKKAVADAIKKDSDIETKAIIPQTPKQFRDFDNNFDPSKYNISKQSLTTLLLTLADQAKGKTK